MDIVYLFKLPKNKNEKITALITQNLTQVTNIIST